MTDFERVVLENQTMIMDALSIILSRHPEEKDGAALLHTMANTCREMLKRPSGCGSPYDS
jgi:hypothetical protein